MCNEKKSKMKMNSPMAEVQDPIRQYCVHSFPKRKKERMNNSVSDDVKY